MIGKNLLLFFFAATPAFSSGAVEMFNLSLTDSSLNYLYMGVTNKLRVTGLENYEGLKLSLGNGTATQDTVTKNIFTVSVNKFGVNMLVLYQNETEVLKKEFTNAPVNKPFGMLAENKDTIQAVLKIYPNPVVGFYIPVCDYNFQAKVVSFKVTFKRKTGYVLKTYAVNGNKLYGEHLLVLKQLEPGDKIVISDVKLSGPDTGIILIKPFTITIRSSQ